MSAAPMPTREAPLHPFELLLKIDQRNRERVAPAARAAQPTAGGRLALRVGSWNLLLPMDDVAEIIPVPRVTRVPGVRSWLMGIANLRGAVMSVIDLKEYLGGKPTAPTASSRLVVVRDGEWNYGLLADEIIGMRHFGPESRVAAAQSIEQPVRPYLTEVFTSEKQQWLAFNIGQLLKDPNFLNAAL